MTQTRGLIDTGATGDPVSILRSWLDDARAAGDPDAEAMTLATAATDGVPSARTVLLTALGDRGLQFHSSAATRKVAELRANPWASVVLRWAATSRQVVASGVVTELGDDENDLSFRSRPRELQLLAWLYESAAPLAVEHPGLIDTIHDQIQARFATGDVPRPATWTGFRLVPRTIEFWQRGAAGRPNARVGFTASRARHDEPAADVVWSRRRMLP